MGEIAEDMVDGDACEVCGVYFEKTHGYPVVCDSCWKDMTPKERKNHQRAIHKEL